MNVMARWDFEHGGWELQCERCGKTFYAKRRDAKFDSAACRKHANRAGERKQKAITELTMTAYQARQIAKKYSGSQDVYDQMVLLKQSLEASLTLFNVTWQPLELALDATPAPSPAAKAKRATKQQKKRYGEASPPAPTTSEAAAPEA